MIAFVQPLIFIQNSDRKFTLLQCRCGIRAPTSNNVYNWPTVSRPNNNHKRGWASWLIITVRSGSLLDYEYAYRIQSVFTPHQHNSQCRPVLAMLFAISLSFCQNICKHICTVKRRACARACSHSIVDGVLPGAH